MANQQQDEEAVAGAAPQGEPAVGLSGGRGPGSSSVPSGETVEHGASCPHGFPSIKSCIDCMYEDGVGADPSPPVTVEFVFAARFDSQCPACNLGVHQGERIAKLSNET